jgi:hypothetical protein
VPTRRQDNDIRAYLTSRVNANLPAACRPEGDIRF